jgi:hypothetical protein
MALRADHEPEWAIQIHERTLQAIMSRDPDQIEAAMDEHLTFLERIWEEESGRARLRKIPDFLLPGRVLGIPETDDAARRAVAD